MPKQDGNQKYDVDAYSYLENNQWDFKTALDAFKADLKIEIGIAEMQKNLKKMNKGKKGKKN